MRVLAAMALMVLAAFAGPAAPVAPADLAGSWEGVIRFPDLSLQVRFEITQQTGGGLKATFDSIDQGARDIPVENVRLEGNRLYLELKVADSAYEGEVNAAGNYIMGHWRQGAKNSIRLNLEKADPSRSHTRPQLSPAELAAAQDAARHFCGVWEGTLEQGGKNTSLRVKIWRAQNGAAKGTLDSYEQQIVNLPLRAIRYKEGEIRFEAPGLGASFKGALPSGADTVSGQWQQSGESTALVLRKAPPPARKGLPGQAQL